jgi:hypothetical protein
LIEKKEVFILAKRFLVLIILLMLGFFVFGYAANGIGPPAQSKSAVDQTRSFADVDTLTIVSANRVMMGNTLTGAQTINTPYKTMAGGTATIESLTKESIVSLADIYFLKNLKETKQMAATLSALTSSLWKDGQQIPVPVMEVPYNVICPVAALQFGTSFAVPSADQTRLIVMAPSKDYSTEVAYVIFGPSFNAILLTKVSYVPGQNTKITSYRVMVLNTV